MRKERKEMIYRKSRRKFTVLKTEINEELYIPTIEDEEKKYYFVPATNKYIGVSKLSNSITNQMIVSYYCKKCGNFNDPIPFNKIIFKYSYPYHQIHETWHRLTPIYHPPCETQACPVCGKPAMHNDNEDSYGYCSPEHRMLELKRMMRICSEIE